METDTIAIIVMIVSPLYGLILYRMKKSDRIETKVTKICTALKLKFPDMADVLK